MKRLIVLTLTILLVGALSANAGSFDESYALDHPAKRSETPYYGQASTIELLYSKFNDRGLSSDTPSISMFSMALELRLCSTVHLLLGGGVQYSLDVSNTITQFSVGIKSTF